MKEFFPSQSRAEREGIHACSPVLGLPSTLSHVPSVHLSGLMITFLAVDLEIVQKSLAHCSSFRVGFSQNLTMAMIMGYYVLSSHVSSIIISMIMELM